MAIHRELWHSAAIGRALRARQWYCSPKLAILLGLVAAIAAFLLVYHVLTAATSPDTQWHQIADQIYTLQRMQGGAEAGAGSAFGPVHSVPAACHLASVLPSDGKWERTVRDLCTSAGAPVP
jgi:hypothetical protein